MNNSPDRNQTRRVLLVDDDALFTDAVTTDLLDHNLSVTAAASVRAGKSICQQEKFDVVLLDSQLPDGNGLELTEDILASNDRAKIILITAFPNFDTAVEALKKGVYDYVSKPIDLSELHAVIERALHTSNLEAVEQVSNYRNDQEKRQSVLIGFNNSSGEIRHLVRQAAQTNASVLITGETGTGKNVIAKMIHHESAQREHPFISLNCAALPETLIESELFGVEKGAYTGATSSRKGIFELADGGTLFLDEIGEMPPPLQSKLLGALEDRQIRRVGGDRLRPVNVRIIAATNAVPETAIAEKRFRRDLFYRLSVIHIHLPPLRERREDIPDLCRHFIEKFAPNRRVQITEKEVQILQNYDFPGNTRELRNIIERCLILQEGDFVQPSKILNLTNAALNAENAAPSIDFASFEFIGQSINADLPLESVESRYILAMFDKHNRNLARTANALAISLSTLKRKLREYGVR